MAKTPLRADYDDGSIDGYATRVELPGSLLSPHAYYHFFGGVESTIDNLEGTASRDLSAVGGTTDLMPYPAKYGCCTLPVSTLSTSAYYGITGTTTAWENTSALSVVVLLKYSYVALLDANTVTLVGRTKSVGDPSTSAYHTNWELILSSELLYRHQSTASGVETATPVRNIELPIGTWIALGFTRDSIGTGITMYLNGFATESMTLTSAPDGGGSSTPHVLYDTVTGLRSTAAVVNALYIYDSELSSANMRIVSERLLKAGELL